MAVLVTIKEFHQMVVMAVAVVVLVAVAMVVAVVAIVVVVLEVIHHAVVLAEEAVAS
jgi:hypothetical protein